jgi:hypothetical protein
MTGGQQVKETHLPHNAEYLTLMIISIGSTILGIGRSSSFTSNVPLKTTAFIVVFDILLFGLFGIVNSELPQLRSIQLQSVVRSAKLQWRSEFMEESKGGTSMLHKRRSRGGAGYCDAEEGHGELDRLQAKAALCEPTSNLLR